MPKGLAVCDGASGMERPIRSLLSPSAIAHLMAWIRSIWWNPALAHLMPTSGQADSGVGWLAHSAHAPESASLYWVARDGRAERSEW